MIKQIQNIQRCGVADEVVESGELLPNLARSGVNLKAPDAHPIHHSQ